MVAQILISVVLSLSVNTTSGIEGKWKMEGRDGAIYVSFNADGTYDVDFNADGNPEIEGKYTIEGSKVKVTDVKGENLCTEVGIYTFKVAGDQLTMTRVEDKCEGRGGEPGESMTMTKA